MFFTSVLAILIHSKTLIFQHIFSLTEYYFREDFFVRGSLNHYFFGMIYDILVQFYWACTVLY